MKLAYLASPYSDPSSAVREERFLAVCRAAAMLLAKGEFVYSPIAHNHPVNATGLVPYGWGQWAAFDRLMIGKCDELIVLQLPGWDKSVGVAAEVEIANEFGLPVHYMDPVA